MFQTKVVEKIKTHILCSDFFFKWYSQRGHRWQTIRCMRILRWIPKARVGPVAQSL